MTGNFSENVAFQFQKITNTTHIYVSVSKKKLMNNLPASYIINILLDL